MLRCRVLYVFINDRVVLLQQNPMRCFALSQQLVLHIAQTSGLLSLVFRRKGFSRNSILSRLGILTKGIHRDGRKRRAQSKHYGGRALYSEVLWRRQPSQ